jgi:hypothetical protein
LKPRRKYWLALPLPECWAATIPGTASSSSATRSSGRTSRSEPPTVPSLAALGHADLAFAAPEYDHGLDRGGRFLWCREFGRAGGRAAGDLQQKGGSRRVTAPLNHGHRKVPAER